MQFLGQHHHERVGALIAFHNQPSLELRRRVAVDVKAAMSITLELDFDACAQAGDLLRGRCGYLLDVVGVILVGYRAISDEDRALGFEAFAACVEGEFVNRPVDPRREAVAR